MRHFLELQLGSLDLHLVSVRRHNGGLSGLWGRVGVRCVGVWSGSDEVEGLIAACREVGMDFGDFFFVPPQ